MPNDCVTIQNGYAGVGTTVAISSCFPTDPNFGKLQKWTFDARNGGSSVLEAAGLCLDAGDNPANGSGMKVWDCYPGLLQQTWSFDGHQITLSNGQALDVVKESTPSYNKPYISEKDLQTWTASTNADPYQQFTFEPVN